MQKNDSRFGKSKKVQKTWFPVWGMQKNAKKMQTNAKNSRAGKVAFLEFPGRPRFPALSRPTGHFTPAPAPPPGFWAGPPKPGPRVGRQLPAQAGPKTNSPGQAPLPYPSSPPAGFPRFSALVPCIWCCHQVTKGLSWSIGSHVYNVFCSFSRSQNDNKMTIKWQTYDNQMTHNDA